MDAGPWGYSSVLRPGVPGSTCTRTLGCVRRGVLREKRALTLDQPPKSWISGKLTQLKREAVKSLDSLLDKISVARFKI